MHCSSWKDDGWVMIRGWWVQWGWPKGDSWNAVALRRGMDGPPMGKIDMKEGCRDENMNDGSGFGTGGGARIGEQNESGRSGDIASRSQSAGRTDRKNDN